MEAEIRPQKFSSSKLPFIIDRSQLNIYSLQGMRVELLVCISGEVPRSEAEILPRRQFVLEVKRCSLSTNCKKTNTIFRAYAVKYLRGVSILSLEWKPNCSREATFSPSKVAFVID